MMKTPDDVMIQIANKHGYSSWSELMIDISEFFLIEYTTEAMEEYANQFKEQPKKSIEEFSELQLNKVHFIPIIQNWLSYKAQKRQAYKPIGLKTLIKKFNQFDGTYSELESIVEHSIMNNYAGIIWDYKKVNNGQSATTTGEALNKFITE